MIQLYTLIASSQIKNIGKILSDAMLIEHSRNRNNPRLSARGGSLPVRQAGAFGGNLSGGFFEFDCFGFFKELQGQYSFPMKYRVS